MRGGLDTKNASQKLSTPTTVNQFRMIPPLELDPFGDKILGNSEGVFLQIEHESLARHENLQLTFTPAAGDLLYKSYDVEHEQTEDLRRPQTDL